MANSGLRDTGNPPVTEQFSTERIALETALRIVEAAAQQARDAKDAAEFAVALGNLETGTKAVRKRGVRRWKP